MIDMATEKKYIGKSKSSFMYIHVYTCSRYSVVTIAAQDPHRHRVQFTDPVDDIAQLLRALSLILRFRQEKSPLSLFAHCVTVD